MKQGTSLELVVSEKDMLPRLLKVVMEIVVVLALGGGLLPQSGTNMSRKGTDPNAVVPYPGNPDAQKAIREIEIDSTLDFGVSSRIQEWSAVFIHREEGVFRGVLRGIGASPAVDGRSIDPALIEALRAALNEPPIRKPDLQNLGITSDWFKEYRSAALNNQLPSSAPKQVVARYFSSPVIVQQAVRSMFNDRASEFSDLRFIRLTVTFDGDSQVSLGSGSGFSPFMLPWDVTRNGKEITTYNANISRALAALMPAETINREYLAGELFPVEVVDAVRRYIDSTHRQRKTNTGVGAAR